MSELNIKSYETLTYTGSKNGCLVYRAPNPDFVVMEVHVDYENSSFTKIPPTVTVSIVVDDSQ